MPELATLASDPERRWRCLEPRSHAV